MKKNRILVQIMLRATYHVKAHLPFYGTINLELTSTRPMYESQPPPPPKKKKQTNKQTHTHTQNNNKKKNKSSVVPARDTVSWAGGASNPKAGNLQETPCEVVAPVCEDSRCTDRGV